MKKEKKNQETFTCKDLPVFVLGRSWKRDIDTEALLDTGGRFPPFHVKTSKPGVEILYGS